MASQHRTGSADIVKRLLREFDSKAKGQETNKHMLEIAGRALHGQRAKKKRSHGNPKWRYQNEMEHQEKVLLGRKLTETEAKEVQAQALFEWDEVWRVVSAVTDRRYRTFVECSRFEFVVEVRLGRRNRQILFELDGFEFCLSSMALI